MLQRQKIFIENQGGMLQRLDISKKLRRATESGRPLRSILQAA